MATSYNSDEELRRLKKEQERLERERIEAERAAAEQAAEAEREAAESTAKAEEEAKAAQEQAQVNLENLQGYAPEEEWDDESLKAFDEKAQLVMGQHNALQKTKVKYTKKEIGELPEQLEPLREEIEAANKSGELKKVGGGAKPWIQNEFHINWGSIEDIDQAVYFASTLTTDNDKLRFFKEYASRNDIRYEEVLSYADEKLGTNIFASPQSNSGKRKAYTSALEKIGLFDVDGNDIKIGVSDFDMVVQSLNNIADEDTAKKAASYVEALTKTPGSAYYGKTFDKSTVAYRDSANLPKKLYDEEVKSLGGIFYTGEGQGAANMETYLARYEMIQANYGSDPFAFRQMEKALKNAYEKQTGYAAPDSAQVQDAIAQIQSNREAIETAKTEEEKKGYLTKIWEFFFGSKKAEEEEAPEIVEGEDYSVREGYIASAGPMPTPAPSAAPTPAPTPPSAPEPAATPAPASTPTPPPEVEEEPAQVQGPQPQVEEEQKKEWKPLSYFEALNEYAKGNLSTDDPNYDQIRDSVGNDDFWRYVLNGATPDEKELMSERAYGGTLLTDAQARTRAHETTTGMQLLGTTLGGAADFLSTGSISQEIAGNGYQLMADIMNDVSRQIRSGRISVPAGENKYDYVINNTPYIKAKAEQLSGLQKEYNQIMTDRAMEAAEAEERAYEESELRWLNGNATLEDLTRLAARANTDVDLYEDETRMQFVHQLSGKSLWYQDDGAFWKGGSAAAEEGMRLRQTREDGLYGNYKLALWDKANQVVDELTYIAADHGMTLGGYLEKIGVSTDDPSAIMDIAYNRMVAEGVQIQNDPETQEAINTIAGVETNGIGMLDASLYGLGHGLADDTYHFMNAGYLMMDEATYDHRRNEIMRECEAEYGKLAPYVRRQQLIAYANSGALSKEMSQELLEDIDRCNNIFDIPLDIDPGLVEGLYLGTMNELSKIVEKLEGVRELLPENERRAWDAMYGVGTNVPGMIRSGLTTIAAASVGIPLPAAKAAGLWMGYGATTFSRGTKKYEDAGMTRDAAMFMGMLEAGGMMAVNLVGMDTAVSMYSGKALVREGIEAGFRDGRWFGAMKAIAKKAAPLMLEEAAEEGAEQLVETGVSMTAPAVQAAFNGELTSFSEGVRMTWEEFKGMDVKEVLGETFAAGKGGAVYGLLFAAPRLAIDTHRGRVNANIQKKFQSIDVASQIVHGELPATDENMGRFIDLMQKDLQNPEFRTLLDKKNDSAEQANYMAVAAVLGEGKENRDAALKLTQKADQYDQKAEAAEKAVEINRSQFYIARKEAAVGNEGALHTMEGFRTAWGKAQTTATENRQAAQKAREDAADQTAQWIHACRKLGNNMYQISKQRAAKLLVSMGEEREADRLEKIAAADEANVDRMDVEAFIEDRYKNHSDEQKDHIREIYGVPVGTKKEPTEPKLEATNEEAQTETTQEVQNGAETAPASTPSEAIMSAETEQQEAETAQELVQTATEAPAAEKPTGPAQKPMQTQTGAQRIEASKRRQLQNATRFAGQVTRRFGVKTEIAPANDARLMLPQKDKDGNAQYAPALYNRKEDRIIISENATQGDVIRAKIVHELTHRTEGTEAYKEFSKAVLGAYFKGDAKKEAAARASIQGLYASRGVNLEADGVESELVAKATEMLIGGDQEMVDRIVADSPTVARRIVDAIRNVLSKLTGVRPEEVDQMKALEQMFVKALDESQKKKKNAGEQYSIPETISPVSGAQLTTTLAGDTVAQFSLSSWTGEERNAVRTNLINHGYDPDEVDNWIDDVDGVAAMVAADRDRLDFEAATQHTMLKPNQEYVKTLDASTLCAKRRIYQGTFNAIQHILKNRVLSSDDLIRIRNMMAEMGYETPCGICYVESRRRNLGTFAKKWLDGYDAKGGYQPSLDDVTTTDGLDRMLKEHPEVYQSFLAEMNRKGSNNPKVVQTRTDYRGEIRDLTDSQIKKIVDIGGLRVQSFSDFETPHLLDMMQAVLDMTDKGLTSQAYTKVPNFAWVFGDTGIKINLSLIAEGDGFDADGNLAFSSYEGMDMDEAMRLRNRYSKNVGTILVGLSDKHIRAAMADDRIDFIIPFHKSGWGKRQLAQLSGMSGYMDYTRDQNERRVIGETKTGKPKTKNVEENFHPVGPSGYWEFDKTGNENAAKYLRMCEEDGRIPKFSRFLTKGADGHWVAPDGYWKLLIDFKMYDNDGVGAPQMPVMPNFNMTEATRILDEYEGGADTLPVAYDVVEKFVEEKSGKGDVQYAIDEASSLPDDNFLRAEIDAWRSNLNYSVEDDNVGKRQFANQTLQNNQYIPDYIKEAFLKDPAKSDYSRESNMRQLNEAWNRVQSEGYEAARDRLVNQETKFDTQDNADALILMRQALHDGDLDTFMAVATKYNTEGTDQSKALQIRSMMRKMTPTGFAQTVIQDISRKIDDRNTKRPGEKRKRDRESNNVKEKLNLENLDDASEADTLNSGKSIVIDNKFGAALNDAKRALIKEFDLEKVARPGDFYNWATTKQRMLEDILTTDDIWAKDSNGMDLVDRLVRMKHGDIVLTKADLQYITDQMAIFNRLTDENSREADLALARAHEAQGNVNGVTGKMKRRTWRYVSMLLSAPSAIRNVIGNTAQSLPNAFADGIAVELDRIVSTIAGTDRTRAHLTARERVEGWEGFLDETFNTFRDYFFDKAVTQHGEGRYNHSQIGRVYQTQGLETLRHLEGFLMSVGDRNFWKKKFLNSMAEQQRLAEINGTEFDVEAAMETAEAEANYATFNEDGKIRKLMSALTEQIPFLDYLMPFVGVPTNIIKRQLQFSPIGLATTAFKHGWAAAKGEVFDQRAFVDGMARGLTGTAMMAVGAALFKGGVLKLGTKEEDDDKSYGVRTAMGDQYGVYFTIGDKNYSITTFSPAASALVAGAFVMDALNNNESWSKALLNGTLKNINEIFDASYMSALGDVLNTSNGKSVVDNLVPAIGSAMLTQNIPAPLSHLASSLDPYVRDTKDKDAMMEVVKTVMNKIPGARELLPAKVDVAGRTVKNTKAGAAAFYDPFTTSNVADDPALSEMMRLRDVLEAKGASDPRGHMASDALSGRKNTLTQNKVTYTVNEQEKEAYRSRYGELWRTGGRTYDKNGKQTTIQGVDELIMSRYYQLLSDEEKAKAIKDILTKAKAGATYETMNHK